MVSEVVTNYTWTIFVKFQKKIRLRMLPLPMVIIFINLLTWPACLGQPKGNSENIFNITVRTNVTSSTSLPPDHRDGGLPLISDSVFSLIIMIYVLLAFFFVFFLFCWKRGPDRPFTNTKVCRTLPLIPD